MNSVPSWRFRLFSFPVQVQLSFLITALFLGLGVDNIIYLLLWILIVFISILLHELGHAIFSNYYGRKPSIELLWSGGVTISSRYTLLSYPKEILISIAGPLVGFIFGGILILLVQITGPFQNQMLSWIMKQLIWVNIGWGIFNLLPILPLDGGSIMQNLYHWFKDPYDDRSPHIISIIFGIITIFAVLAFFQREGIYLSIVIGLLTFNNYLALTKGTQSGGIF